MKPERNTGPTPERLARAGKDVEPVNTEPDTNPNYKNTVRLLDGSILDTLASRGVITGDQYGAGSQFYSDWYYSGLANSGVIDPCRVVVDGETHKGQSNAVQNRMWKALRCRASPQPWRSVEKADQE